jgi:hypothetical protein
LAFHEVRVGDDAASFPHVPLWDLTVNLIQTAFRSSIQNYYAADRLVEHFSEAGLPFPHLFCEKPVGGGAESPLYRWLAELLQSLQPQLDKMRIVPGEMFTTNGLESRLRDAVVEARSQIFGPSQVCAWARL